jgi:Esterase FrsA-like
VRAPFKNDDFQFGYEIALGSSGRGYADPGEVLAVAGRIKDGDADAWVREWAAAARDRAEEAGAAEAAGHRTSACRLFLRAANYYATASYLVAHSKTPERQQKLWTGSRSAWDKAVDLLPAAGERLRIPYEDTTLPGYFFRAPDAAAGEPRPLVVMNNGSDGATADMGLQGGFGAADRGYHWLAFDGPGQQAALFEQHIPFRHDWEAVLTPVLDAMTARPDVVADKIAVIGVSQGGYWVPRALAFEHRFAAAVADPGVVDVSTSWTAKLPKRMRAELDDPSKKESFDKEMGWTERFSKSTRATLHFRGEPYGIASGSRYDLYQEVLKQRLGDEVANIATPLLITDPEDEQFWPGQSQELYDRLPGPKEIVRFTAAEGAARHCEPLAPGLRETRIFNWLDGYLS